MGSTYLFTLQQALKEGVFYWLRIQNSNNLHTELSLGYLKDTKFYGEIKAFFIHISSIAAFKPFFIVWWWEYCTFSDSSVVSFKSSPWPKHTQYGTIFPKKIKFYYQTFFSSSNMLFIRLFLAKTWKKNRGLLGLFPHKLLWKCGHGLGDHSHARELARWGLGRDTKWCPCYAQKRLPIAKPGNHLKVSFPSILFFLVWKGTLT